MKNISFVAVLTLILVVSFVQRSVAASQRRKDYKKLLAGDDDVIRDDVIDIPKSRQKRYLLLWCLNFPTCCQELDAVGDDKCAFACPVCPTPKDPYPGKPIKKDKRKIAQAALLRLRGNAAGSAAASGGANIAALSGNLANSLKSQAGARPNLAAAGVAGNLGALAAAGTFRQGTGTNLAALRGAITAGGGTANLANLAALRGAVAGTGNPAALRVGANGNNPNAGANLAALAALRGGANGNNPNAGANLAALVAALRGGANSNNPNAGANLAALAALRGGANGNNPNREGKASTTYTAFRPTMDNTPWRPMPISTSIWQEARSPGPVIYGTGTGARSPGPTVLYDGATTLGPGVNTHSVPVTASFGVTSGTGGDPQLPSYNPFLRTVADGCGGHSHPVAQPLPPPPPPPPSPTPPTHTYVGYINPPVQAPTTDTTSTTRGWKPTLDPTILSPTPTNTPTTTSNEEAKAPESCSGDGKSVKDIVKGAIAKDPELIKTIFNEQPVLLALIVKAVGGLEGAKTILAKARVAQTPKGVKQGPLGPDYFADEEQEVSGFGDYDYDEDDDSDEEEDSEEDDFDADYNVDDDDDKAKSSQAETIGARTPSGRIEVTPIGIDFNPDEELDVEGFGDYDEDDNFVGAEETLRTSASNGQRTTKAAAIQTDFNNRHQKTSSAADYDASLDRFSSPGSSS